MSYLGEVLLVLVTVLVAVAVTWSNAAPLARSAPNSLHAARLVTPSLSAKSDRYRDLLLWPYLVVKTPILVCSTWSIRARIARSYPKVLARLCEPVAVPPSVSQVPQSTLGGRHYLVAKDERWSN